MKKYDKYIGDWCKVNSIQLEITDLKHAPTYPDFPFLFLKTTKDKKAFVQPRNSRDVWSVLLEDLTFMW